VGSADSTWNAPTANSATPSLSTIGGDFTGGNYTQGFSDLGSKLSANAGLLLGGGVVGMDLLKANQKLPGQAALGTEAAQLSSEGATLQGYLSSGTLPAGLQQSIVQASDAAKATIRSRYAQSGGDTSAMQQELNNVDLMASTQGANIATQLMNTGVNETQLSSQLYTTLLNQATSQDATLSQALGSLAMASAGTPTVFKLSQ
jgi:hypothetical protein